MKTIALTLLGLWAAGSAMADELRWLTSVPQALAQAQRENKTVLLDFTGSDWCGWCKKLDADTFSKSEFAEYAEQHLVLVELDFPHKTAQPADLKAANKELETKYKVRGFPTLVQLAPDGKVLWEQTGYLPGGPTAMISKLGGSPNLATAPTPAPVSLAAVSYPAPPPRPAGAEPRLQGIFWSASHPTAILEGKSCEEGDSINGMKVVKIARDRVTVQWNGETKELVMK